MAHKFEGIFVALVTPMTADHEVDYSALCSTIEHMLACGVKGIIPLGSTGEFYALSPDERRAVAAETIDAVAGRAAVLVGVNAGSTRAVTAYARQAETLGADGVLLAAPFYSLPTQDELVEHVRRVDDAVGIAIMLYNCPARTGVDMTPQVIERLAGLRNVRYVKESTGDLPRIEEIIRRCGRRISVFCGCDTLAVESFEAGAVGWVGGVANVLPSQHVELYERAVLQKDPAAARAVYQRMRSALEMFENGGKYTQFVKAGCALMGRPVGPPRQPLLPATAEDINRLRQALAECA